MGDLQLIKKRGRKGTGIMKKYLLPLIIVLFILPIASVNAQEFRELPFSTYIDKMKAGWLGPTEFEWIGEVIPVEKMPKWKP
jgi:hypothetical protein